MELTQKHCVPCEGDTPPFTTEQEDDYIKKVSSWTLHREGIHKLKKRFSFKNFKEAIAFVNRVAEVAEEEGHHPDICIVYNKVECELFTHTVGGLTENDFIMTSKIDKLFLQGQQRLVTT
jgi:4a-hydroxytetrahydrobiopterin dehydratase